MAVVGVATFAIKKLTDAATRLSSDLAPYSGPLAAAQARSQVLKLQEDIRSSQRLGSSLAKFSDSQARVERDFQRIRDSLVKAGLELINPTLERIADALDFLVDADKDDNAADFADLFGLFGISDLGPMDIEFGGNKFTPGELKKGGQAFQPNGDREFDNPFPAIGI